MKTMTEAAGRCARHFNEKSATRSALATDRRGLTNQVSHIVVKLKQLADLPNWFKGYLARIVVAGKAWEVVEAFDPASICLLLRENAAFEKLQFA